ncbi:MAG TPA: hypothetical protein VK530_14325 [Candidatus Acidoferrum sp.]|nr:hypothetical protein [Candidatus Acidoferrum sp.]
MIFVPLLCALITSMHGASLQVFAVVYGQVTNDIALIQTSFDSSSAQKQKLARLVASRNGILDPAASDEQVLAKLVAVLAPENDYDALLDEVAINARAALLGRYATVSERLELLPPSPRTVHARNRFQDLSADLNALNNAQHAAGISAQLAPFGRSLDATDQLIARAIIMPRPKVHANGVRATVNERRFSSAGADGHSPNLLDITAPTPFYRELSCRVVDRERVIMFTIPVLTEQARYEIGQGLAAFSLTEDVFEPGAEAVSATSGTFWVQTVKDEVYGTFSCAGPGLDVKDGRFRIKLPRELRE